jgi:hypothetical protein
MEDIEKSESIVDKTIRPVGRHGGILLPLLTVSFFAGLLAGPAYSEHRCEAHVRYVVRTEPRNEVNVTLPVATHSAVVTPAPSPTHLTTNQETTVDIGVIEVKGADELSAKAALQKASIRHLERAREFCAEKHENVGSCVSSKFATHATTLQRLGFSARITLEESLRSDCEAARGKCIKAELSEAVCSEIVVAVASPSPEAEAGKDEKKKKK